MARTSGWVWAVAALVGAACAGPKPGDDGDGDASPSDTAGGDTDTDATGDVDADGDGFLAEADCDDHDADVFPGAGEICDGRDEDCDGAIDEDALDAVATFLDVDGDGFGDPATAVVGCPVAGQITRGGDCDDADETVFPGAPERCGGRDDDCDPSTLEVAELNGVPQASIADALAAALAGDVITVCAGTHREHDLGVTVDVSVVGATGDPADTVIDAEGAGAAFVVQACALTLEGLTLRGGIGRAAAAIGGLPAGGAVSALGGPGGDVTARSCVFDGNTAYDGGAISAPRVTLDGCVFTGNVATDRGGAVDVRAAELGAVGRLTVTATVFDGNTAGTRGGAVAIEGDAVLTDATFTGNTTADRGGAFAMTAGPATFSGCTLASNSATTVGGGVYTEAFGSAVTMDAATILTDNDAPAGGGAHALFGVTWTGGTFSANRATDGAGLFVGSASTVTDVVLDGNVASNLGGGLRTASTVTVSGVTLAHNTAARGGGAYVQYGTATFEDTTFDANTADLGGGLYAALPSVTLSGGAFTGNTAAFGGGVFDDGAAFGDGRVEVVGVDFGTDAADNTPDDLAVSDDASSDPAAVYTDWGFGATYTCQSRPTAGCQ